MKMWMGGEEVFIEVVSFDEYPRNAAGFCALCNGNPCNENRPPDSLFDCPVLRTRTRRRNLSGV